MTADTQEDLFSAVPEVFAGNRVGNRFPEPPYSGTKARNRRSGGTATWEPPGTGPGGSGVPALIGGNREPGHLRAWLEELKRRGVQITLSADGPQVAGPADDHDRAMADRYRHALTIAATGTHPAWWTHILHPDQPVTATDLPTTPDHTPDGLAFRCGTCGRPADTLDAELVGWCEVHR